MLWVQIPPELLTKRPRGAARSARYPVTVEIVGSNPIGDAFAMIRTARHTTSQGRLVQREDAWLATRRSGFDSPAGPLKNGRQPDTVRRAGLLNRAAHCHVGSNPTPSAT